jgi:hypothetical protein
MTALDAVLTVPETWIVCSLDPIIDAKQIPTQIDEHIKHRRRLKSYRKLMTTAANDWAERCRQSGSMAAALRWDISDSRPPVPLFAYLDIAAAAAERVGSVEAGLEHLLEQMAQPHPDDEVKPQVSLVDLSIGQAVRREMVRGYPDGAPMQLAVEFWVPFEDSPDVLLLQFSSSNLAAAARLTPEFDLIAAQLAVSPAS